MTRREMAIAAPLLALAILFGVYPQAVFDYMTPSVEPGGGRTGRLDERREAAAVEAAERDIARKAGDRRNGNGIA